MFVSFESHLIIAGGQIMICFLPPPPLKCQMTLV